MSLLRRMFSLNTGRPRAQFPVSSLAIHRILHLEPRPRFHCPTLFSWAENILKDEGFDSLLYCLSKGP